MTSENVALLLKLAFALVLVGGVVAGITYVKQQLRRLSRALFRTDSLIEGYKKTKDAVAERPKSVTSMTSLMEPQIVKDFPDFNWNTFKGKAETMLLSSLAAIAAGDASLVKEASEEAKNKVRSIIESNEAADVKVHYDNPHIHQTEIANYVKGKDKCVITIQSAIEYNFYKLQGDKVIEGDRERKTQTKYNLEMIYIRDPNLVSFDNAVGVKCPNCGAPITSLGHMVCEYCGAEVTPINTKVWSLHDFSEVDYNHI